jgi:hypothetical protein
VNSCPCTLRSLVTQLFWERIVWRLRQACAFRIALQSLWGQLPRRRFGAVPFSSRQLQDVLRDSYLFTQKLFPGFLQALIADGWVIPLTKLGGGGFIVTRG